MNVALSGVARKLMGACLALMKEKRPYEPAPPGTTRRDISERPPSSASHITVCNYPSQSTRQHARSLSHIRFSWLLS